MSLRIDRIAVCAKRVDLRPEVDHLTGEVRAEERDAGASPADRAALEVALQLGEAWGAAVELVTAGPVTADAMLRDLGAAGATRLGRVQLDPAADSASVAAALSAAVAGADLVVCGDHSLDRGSGSVPAFLAHHLGVAPACGLTSVEPVSPGVVRAVRRLGGGRAELIEVEVPAVLSVEGAVASLRRASLAAAIAADDRTIDVVAAGVEPDPRVTFSPTRPWHPPTRLVPAPQGATRDRVVALTGALVERTPPRTIEANPADAADAIVEQLRTWGYVA